MNQHLTRIREIAHAAKTDEQGRYAAKLLKYAAARRQQRCRVLDPPDVA